MFWGRPPDQGEAKTVMQANVKRTSEDVSLKGRVNSGRIFWVNAQTIILF